MVLAGGTVSAKMTMLWAFGDGQSLTGFDAFGFRIQMHDKMLHVWFTGSYPIRLNACQFTNEKYQE